MNIPNTLCELLYEHDCVIVPGFGGFVTNYRPARIHPVLHTFSPPAKDLLFNPRLVINDGILVHYLSLKKGIPYEQALQQIQEEVAAMQHELEHSRKVEILNIGSLYKDAEGNLQFEPANKINFLLSSYGLGAFVSPPVQQEKVIPHEKLRDRTFENRTERRLPVAVKRTLTIGIPAAAMLAFAIFSAGNIGTFISQTSDLFPRFGSKNSEMPVSTDVSKKSAQSFQHTLYNLKEHGLRTVDPEALQSTAVTEQTGNFCIVGNCFSVEENAARYTSELKEKGFPGASYFKPASANLYRVYFSRHATREEAEAALTEIKKQHAPQAWILEM